MEKIACSKVIYREDRKLCGLVDLYNYAECLRKVSISRRLPEEY